MIILESSCSSVLITGLCFMLSFFVVRMVQLMAAGLQSYIVHPQCNTRYLCCVRLFLPFDVFCLVGKEALWTWEVGKGKGDGIRIEPITSSLPW